MPNQADTCRRFVVPKLQAAGCDADARRLNEQVTFTEGRIIAAGSKGHQRRSIRADYLLPYRPDLAIAVVDRTWTSAQLDGPVAPVRERAFGAAGVTQQSGHPAAKSHA